DWPHLGLVGIDQVWFSDIDFREQRFSSFAYQYISYDLFLDGWVGSAPEHTEAELGYLEDIPKMRTLLKECEAAAREELNTTIIRLVQKAREFMDALENAIAYRWKAIGYNAPFD